MASRLELNPLRFRLRTKLFDWIWCIKMANYSRDCVLCRVMRSMAFSGAGAAVGAIGAMLLGATRQETMIAALVFAAIFVFGFVVKR